MDLLGQIRQDMALEANIWKSYLYRVLWNFQLWWPIWVIYLLEERGLSLTQITLLDAPYWLLIVFAEVPTGAVADRFGRRTSLVLGSALYGAAIFVFGIADSYAIILASYLVWGLGQTFQSGADAALLYDSLKRIGREDEFQQVNSRLWALTSAAVLVAILIGAPIAAATSLAFPILLSSFIALAAIPLVLSMREPYEMRHEDHEPYFQMVTNGIRDAWNAPQLRYIILFTGIMFAMTFAPLIFVQPYLQEHDITTSSLGFWQAPVRGAGILGALMTYRFVSMVGQRSSFFFLPLAMGFSYLALSGFDSVWAYAAFLPVGLVAGMQNPVLASYVNARIPSERRATMLSVQSVVGSIFIALMEVVSGVVADASGLRVLFLMFGAITLIAAPAVLLLWNRAEEQARRSEADMALAPGDSTREAVTAS